MSHREIRVLRASVFCLVLALVSVGRTFAQSGGQTLYNGIILPQQWPPSESPTQTYQVPTYITNPPPVIFIDVGRQLFVDDFLIQQTTMTRTQHQPVMYPSNPIIAPGPSGYQFLMPFSDGAWFDPSDQLFKIWLYCGGATGSGICYEYSTDGKNWISPSIPDAAVPNTDIVLLQGGLVVWMDLQDPNPARKFKAFIYLPGATYQVLLYCSSDGIHWTSTLNTQYPIPLVYDRTTFFWNPFRDVWVDSMKDYLTLPSAPTRGGYLTRARNYAESPDLMNWTPGEPANPSDPALLTNSYWTGPDENDPPYVPGGVPPQLYNLDAVAYESVVVGLFNWFYPGPAENDPNNLPGPDLLELGVGFSRDGFQWVRPTRGSGPGPNGAFIPASNIPGTWNMGNTQSAGGGFLVVGDELWFYFSGRSGPHADPNVLGSTGLATLRRDGFYSMDAGSSGAYLTTLPVQFSGKYMFVNVKDPHGSLSIQVLNPSTGAVLATSLPLTADKTLQAVSWDGVADLSQFANQPVEFQFNLTNGELYSFWVTSSSSGASNGYVAAGGPGFTGAQDNLGTVAYPTTAATPEISPAGAVFANSASVTIFTGTLGSTIYYTLDGSTPTMLSPIYTGPFTLTATSTVQAIASAPGLSNSAIASALFTMDNVPPMVSITSPANGAALSAGITLLAAASDNVGVANVEFLVDGVSVGTVSTPPYRMTLKTTTLTNATHQLTAIATDLAGNQTPSSAVTVTVQNVLTGPTAGLVGYWSFDTAYVNGESLFDQSGNNNNATGYFTISVPGAVGQAVQFNGSSSYAEVGTATGLYDLTGNLSLSLWVQTFNSSRDEALVSKYAAGNAATGYLLRTTPAGTAELLLGGANVASGTDIATDTTKINDGNWHHLAVVIQLGVNVSFYVDGALSSTETISSTAGVSASLFQMGVNSSGTEATFFTGSMDEVRVYNRALSATDVVALAGSALVTPTSVNLSGGQQQQFTANIRDVTNQTVAWSISPASGTISGSGIYTAPAAVTVAQAITVTATSSVDMAKFATAIVNLTTGAAVNFVGADTLTQGNWHGFYGTDGYAVANDSQSSAAYASFAIANEANYTWAASTSDPRALQTGNGTGRIAAAWYNPTTFSFNVNVTDGNLHPLALYLLDWDNKAREETIQIVDANTNALLDTRSISGFNNGIYLIWNISGSIRINVICNAGPNGAVSGLFFGASGSHSESVGISPQSSTLGAGQTQQFTAAVGGATSQQVTWSILSVNPATAPAGSFSSPASGLYSAPQTGLVAAQVTVQATSADGHGSATATVNLTTGAVANFNAIDTITQGNWQKLYGAEGYAMAPGYQSLPAYGSFAVENQSNWIWAPSTTDLRALQIPSVGGVAATWYAGGSFTFDVNMGANSHQFALYAVDWDSRGRSETVQIQDADTGILLDKESISNFSAGIYLNWVITGHVTIIVTTSAGPNAVVSGVFFGGEIQTPPSQTAPTISSVSNTTFTVGEFGTFTVTAAGLPTAMLSETGPLPSGVTFNATTGVLSGTPATGSSPSYPLIFTASNGVTPNASLDFTLTVNPQVVTSGSAAAFVTADTATQGNWMGTYGADGYDLASGPQLPAGGQLSYGSYSLQNQAVWTWAPSTSDTRALQTDDQGDRVAAAWYSSTTFSFNVNLIGTHQVALYVLDWDSKGRGETVKILDVNNNVLDMRAIPNSNTNTIGSNFVNGTYLVWNISGQVTITLTTNSGPNAVISGIFFGAGGTVTLPASATAIWAKSDTATEGTWMGVYGSQGYSLATGGQNIQNISIPATFAVQNQKNWVWASSTGDTRALETDAQGDRVAAAWYSTTEFNLNLNLTDGQTHQVAVYVVDWDNKGRGETISIADANSGTVLDTRSIPNTNANSTTYTNTTATNFFNGTYLVWNISGSVTITITSNSGPNAVISGVFLDP